MAASLNECDEDSVEEAHEINVTPFIEVILVLLIILMVAPPLPIVGLPIDLPSSTAAPQKTPNKPTYVTIKADRAVAAADTPVKRVDLVEALDRAPEVAKDKRILLRADKVVPYGELMDLLERLRIGDYRRVALMALESMAEVQGRGEGGQGSGHQSSGTTLGRTPLP